MFYLLFYYSIYLTLKIQEFLMRNAFDPNLIKKRSFLILLIVRF